MNRTQALALPDLPSPAAVDARSSNPARRQLSSDALFNGHRDVLIQHGSEIYLLRHTRNGKLILTK